MGVERLHAAVRLAPQTAMNGSFSVVIDSMSISIEKKWMKRETRKMKMLKRRINLKNELIAPLWDSLKK